MLGGFSMRTGNFAGRFPTLLENDRMNARIEGNKLIIEMDLQKPTPSATGKTLVVASSRGNVQTAAMVDGKPVTIGVNAYIPPR